LLHEYPSSTVQQDTAHFAFVMRNKQQKHHRTHRRRPPQPRDARVGGVCDRGTHTHIRLLPSPIATANTSADEATEKPRDVWPCAAAPSPDAHMHARSQTKNKQTQKNRQHAFPPLRPQPQDTQHRGQLLEEARRNTRRKFEAKGWEVINYTPAAGQPCFTPTRHRCRLPPRTFHARVPRS